MVIISSSFLAGCQYPEAQNPALEALKEQDTSNPFGKP